MELISLEQRVDSINRKLMGIGELGLAYFTNLVANYYSGIADSFRKSAYILNSNDPNLAGDYFSRCVGAAAGVVTILFVLHAACNILDIKIYKNKISDKPTEKSQE